MIHYFRVSNLNQHLLLLIIKHNPTYRN